MLYCVCSDCSVLLNKNYQMFTVVSVFCWVCVWGGGGVEENSIFFGLKTLVRFVSEPFFTKRAAVSKSLLSVFVKENKRATVSKLLFKKSYMRSNSTFALLLSKTSDLLNKICCFHHVFIAFPLFIPFYTLLCPRANRSCCSSLFKKE